MPVHRPLPALLWAGLLLAPAVLSARTPAVDLDALLGRVGDQLERYFQRAQSIVSTETVWVRSFDRSLRPRGRPRRLEYEQRVEWDAAGDDGVPSVRVRRELLSLAPVDRELHRSATETADSVSPEITACAYATHARMSSGYSSG